MPLGWDLVTIHGKQRSTRSASMTLLSHPVTHTLCTSGKTNSLRLIPQMTCHQYPNLFPVHKCYRRSPLQLGTVGVTIIVPHISSISSLVVLMLYVIVLQEIWLWPYKLTTLDRLHPEFSYPCMRGPLGALAPSYRRS